MREAEAVRTAWESKVTTVVQRATAWRSSRTQRTAAVSAEEEVWQLGSEHNRQWVTVTHLRFTGE